MEQQPFEIRDKRNEIHLMDIIHIGFSNWYWFLLSLMICLGVAVLYLMSAPKIYTRTASVLIKDNNKGGGMSESAAFEELNMFNIKNNVDNEILVFQSGQLMKEVARRLQLDVSYEIKKD